MIIPLNRIIAWFGPGISMLAGLLYGWLVSIQNVFAIPGLDQNMIAKLITAGAVALLGAVLHWRGFAAWLKGHHIEIAGGTWSGDPTDLLGDAVVRTVELPPVADPRATQISGTVGETAETKPVA